MESLEALDIGTFYWFQSSHQDWLTPIMVVLTHIGNAKTVIAVLGVILVGLFLKRQYTMAAALLTSALLGLGINYAVKNMVQRARPDLAEEQQLVREPTTFSFPSGHSGNSMSTYFGAALLFARRFKVRRRQVLLPSAAFLLCLAIGISRLYLGVHWLTDVLAGWSLGLACALFACWIDRRRPVTIAQPTIDPAERPFVV